MQYESFSSGSGSTRRRIRPIRLIPLLIMVGALACDEVDSESSPQAASGADTSLHSQAPGLPHTATPDAENIAAESPEVAGVEPTIHHAAGPKKPVPPTGSRRNIGLTLKVGETSEFQNTTSKRAPTGRTEALSERDTRTLLKRLPALKEPNEIPAFKFRERSKPAPRTGETVTTDFPPSTAATVERPQRDVAPLEVRRFSPEGEVPIAPKLSVTFSQPMVDVTSHEALNALVPPVKISPPLVGKWRWVGTKTLLFETDARFSMATSYTVEIPAGTKSALGGELPSAVRWSFHTPPAVLKAMHPVGGPHDRQALMYARFDQAIDAETVLKHLRVRAGGQDYQVRLASNEELDSTDVGRLMTAGAEASYTQRQIAFRTVKELPSNTTVTVAFDKGMPSAEGPRTTTASQTFSYQTYGPFELRRTRCGWGDQCPPLTPFSIEMSNAFDVEAFDSSQVDISPKIGGSVVEVSGRWLTIRGMTAGRTTYTATLKRGLKDRFGQTLKENRQVTFRVTEAAPFITAQGGDFLILDPASKRKSFQFSSVNHDAVQVNLYRVAPADWSTWRLFATKASQVNGRPEPPGVRVFSQRIEIATKRDELVHTSIDLSPALRDGLGHVVVEIEPIKQENARWRTVLLSWVQSTQIGLDIFRDGYDLHAWTTSLMTGAPLDGARIRSLPARFEGITNADGLVSMPLPATNSSEQDILVAEWNGDVALLPESKNRWSSRTSWKANPTKPALRWFVFDDRKLYKPSETVHVKGWIRRVSGGKTPMVGPLQGAANTLSWVLRDSRNNDVAKGIAKLNAAGGFHFKVALTDTMNLGSARIEMNANTRSTSGGRHTHSLQVQEFRRPEFEVKTTPSAGPHLVGGNATVAAMGSYFAGGPLSDAKVQWSIRSRLSSYTPPNRSEYTFGTWTPWWESQRSNRNGSDSTMLEGRTDSSGHHIISIDFEAVHPPRAATVIAEANLQDINRQTFSASSTLLVHPSEYYVGLKSNRTFIKSGETLQLDAILVDIDGKAVPGRPMDINATRMEWRRKKGTWTQEAVETMTCKLLSGADAVQCKLTPKNGGQWRITADVVDDAGRKNQTQRTFWVAGGKMPVSRKVAMEKLTLIPSEAEYQPGDTAELLVQSPIVPAEGLMSVRVGGILKQMRFKMTESTTTLRVPIEAEYVPDVSVKVDVVGAVARLGRDGEPVKNAPLRPAFAAGQIKLRVPPYRQTLEVVVEPSAEEVDPGGVVSVDVRVLRSDGQPVPNAEVALVMVDEAVLALTGYRIPDPVSMFYRRRGYTGRDAYSRSSILLVDPDVLPKIPAAQKPGFGAKSRRKFMSSGSLPQPAAAMQEAMTDDAETGADAGSPIGVRKNFDALAAFSPVLHTDKDGRAKLPVDLPDNLTRYRITAVAVEGGTRFGKGESTVTARLPLMVRPSAPRFLNFGDRFELPVVLQNQTDTAMSVDVVVQSTAVEMTEGQGRRLVVPANDRVEVRFPASVSNVGTARFQIGVAAGDFTDAAMVELPVYTPATTEAFATYGVLDGRAVIQPVRAPTDVVTQFGGLQITTSSTALQALTDAVLYLMSYPYECAEQVSSRVMAVASLRDVLSAFKADGLPSPSAMLEAVDRDLKKLQTLQHGDGGFGFWKRSDRAWPYLSVHVAHALVRAKRKGFDVSQRMLNSSVSYLRDIERKYPGWYHAETRRTITSYALYVRQLHGDSDPAAAASLIAAWGGVDKTPLEALGWLLSVVSPDPGFADLVLQIRRHLNNRVTETAGNAHWVTNYQDGAHLLLHSSRRTDGVLLDAMIGDQPKSELIPKVVRGLLAHRKQGRWGNTQENAFVLLALDRYFNTYEKQTPDFVARVWLGEQYAGANAFKGRTTEQHRISIPMNVLASLDGRQPLTLGKDGVGRMYYRVGMNYAPSDLALEPADHGFVVLRRYEGVDNKGDVKQREDGTWEVKAGARVRVVLSMVAESRRYHVALVDQLPAGFEPMNPGLKGMQAIPPSLPSSAKKNGSGPYGRYWRWWGPWFEHQNLRDERVEAFTSLLWDGVYTYSYVARATTPGQFVVPPAKAEEMYSPETFGRSGTDRVHVIIH